MVPSKLKDMPLEGNSATAAQNPSSTTTATGSGGRLGGGSSQALVKQDKRVAECNNLHSVYRLLTVAQCELLSGSTDLAEEDDFDSGNDSEDGGSSDHNGQETKAAAGTKKPQPRDESADQLSNAFRQHLFGLFHLLDTLTDAANHISRRYQDEFEAIKL